MRGGSWTLREWLKSTITTLAISFIEPGSLGSYGIILLTVPWLVCLVRRSSQLRADVELCSEGASRLRVLWTWMTCAWYVPIDLGLKLPNLTLSRYTIYHNHKWCIYYMFAYLDTTLAYRVIRSAVSATGDGYVLSYGQVRMLICAAYHRITIEYPPVQLLSVFFAIPTLISTAKFIFSDVFRGCAWLKRGIS